jgi:restriction endonuclease S subunit
MSKEVQQKGVLIISKETILASSDYNLSGDRYRTTTDYTNAKWPMVELGDVFLEIKNGKNVDQFDGVGKYKVSRIQTIATGVFDLDKTKYTNDIVEESSFLQEGDILFSHINSFDHLAKTAIYKNIKEKVVHGSNLLRFRADKLKIIPEYALAILKNEFFINEAKKFAQKAVNQASINSTSLKTIQIPLPPLSVQEEIVREIDGYQKIIDGAKQVIANWRPKIDIDPSWKKVKLGGVCDVTSSKRVMQSDYVSSGIPFYRTKEISELEAGIEPTTELFISKKQFEDIKTKYSIPKYNNILISAVGTLGKVWRVPKEYEEFYFKDGNLLWLKNINKYSEIFLEQLLKIKLPDFIDVNKAGAAYSALTIEKLKEMELVLPPIEIQNEIVERIEEEKKLVEANKKLVEIYEEKVKNVIQKVWG